MHALCFLKNVACAKGESPEEVLDVKRLEVDVVIAIEYHEVGSSAKDERS